MHWNVSHWVMKSVISPSSLLFLSLCRCIGQIDAANRGAVSEDELKERQVWCHTLFWWKYVLL
jgi:hypothetical protein